MASWTPLESNPEVMNKLIHRLGVFPLWSLLDVYSLDKEILEFIPRPVKTVIFLFPIFDKFADYCKVENEKLLANPPAIPEGLFHMKQCIRNACGTIALVHGIANTDVELDNNGILKKYLDAARPLSTEERGKLLEADTAFAALHKEIACEGQTNADLEEINHHFIAFVNFNNELYELDGCKAFPIKHGNTTADTLLEDAAQVCQSIVNKNPDNIRFGVIALAPNVLD